MSRSPQAWTIAHILPIIYGIMCIIFKYKHTLQIEPVPELTGNKRSYLFAIFRRFGPGRSVISVDSAESGSVTAFTHNPTVLKLIRVERSRTFCQLRKITALQNLGKFSAFSYVCHRFLFI